MTATAKVKTKPKANPNKNLEVADCMTKDFAQFDVNMPAAEAAAILAEHEYIGGPVVDENGALVGWVSEQDLLPPVMQVFYFSERVASVAKVMRTDVLSVKIDDSVIDLAKMMTESKPKLLPVIDDNNHVLGVISRKNILKEMCSQINY